MSDKRIDDLLSEAKTLRYSRRQVMRRAVALGLSVPAVTAAMTTSGYAGPNHVRKFDRAPAQLEGTSLTVLGASYFVLAGQERFDAQLQEWGDANGVDVTVDYVAWPDLQTRIGASIQAQSGPDIIQLWDPWPYLYQENLVNLNDIATPIGDATGGYFDWVVNTASVAGSWHSIPYGTSSSAFAYRMSYFQEAGAETFPETWEELFAVGKTLKEMGKPLGQALGHSLGDPPSFAYPYMWAYGAMEVEEDGTTVAFNRPEFVEGMEIFLQGWSDAFDETGLSWDDSANNTAYLSDQISATLNGSSIYIRAQGPEEDGGNPAIAEDTNHAGYPSGPAGRFNLLGAQSWGITSYSDNIEGAKSFLEYWYSPEQLTSWYEANEGYYIPATPEYTELDVYTDDPKLAPYLELVDYGRNKGYAGPADQRAALSFSRYVVIDTFAKAVQDGDAQGAIEWGADQLERIYSR
jgi:multiple sugar transport system substrate-binding protein